MSLAELRLQDFIQDESKPLDDRKWIWTHYGTFYRVMCTMRLEGCLLVYLLSPSFDGRGSKLPSQDHGLHEFDLFLGWEVEAACTATGVGDGRPRLQHLLCGIYHHCGLCGHPRDHGDLPQPNARSRLE